MHEPGSRVTPCEHRGLISVLRTTGNGASFSFPLAPAEVRWLNRHRPFSLGGGNGSKCPLEATFAPIDFERLSRVEIRHSFRRPEAAIRATAGEPSGYGPFPTHGQA